MARNYQRGDRDWRRGQQQPNPSEQNRWSGRRRDDDYQWTSQDQENRNWRSHDLEEPDWRRRNPEEGEWRGEDPGRENWASEEEWRRRSRQGMQGGDRPWTDNMQRFWGGGERENREADYRGRQASGWGEMNEGYGHLGGRGWYEGMRDAMHREGQYAGRGPRNYKRSDNRIEEDINDRLTQHSMIDASDVEVSVQNGEVTLRGQVTDRYAKRLAEEIAESVFGAHDVNNQIKVKQKGESEETGSGKQRKAS